MRRTLLAIATILAPLLPTDGALAQQLTFAVDVPALLGGTSFGSNQLVRYDAASGYGLANDLSVALGAAGRISALTELSPGVFDLSIDAPTTISGVAYQPGDILKYNGSTFTLAQSAGSLGLPAGVAIGALARVPSSGNLLISLTAPATIGGNSYLPGDLLQFNGSGLSLWWRSTNYGIPAGARISGAEVMADGLILVTFDIPVTVASTTFLPGTILQFSGSFLVAPFYRDAAFPAGASMSDFALPGSPGSVPDGTLATVPLKLTKTSPSGAAVVATWGSSCATEVTGYGLYEGTLGSWYGHSPLGCLGSATSTTFSPSSGNRYYLVVPNNGDYEGGYGTNSGGGSIPPGSSPCRSHLAATACP